MGIYIFFKYFFGVFCQKHNLCLKPFLLDFNDKMAIITKKKI